MNTPTEIADKDNPYKFLILSFFVVRGSTHDPIMVNQPKIMQIENASNFIYFYFICLPT